MNKKIILSLAISLCVGTISASGFSDINDHKFQEAIDYIESQSIINGYQDGTFKPNNTINRAEFTKIIVGSLDPDGLEEYVSTCFSDIEESSWFLKYVCYAKEHKIINGYEDGTFKPNQNISIVEASKILVLSLNLKEGESNLDWFSPYISGLEAQKAIPDSIKDLKQEITRGEMAEMIWRLLIQKTDLSTTNLEKLDRENIQITIENEDPKDNKTEEEIQDRDEDTNQESDSELNSPSSCQSLGEDLPSSLNMDEIRQAWLDWTNEERLKGSLTPYSINPQLNRTATAWSEKAKERGYLDHKRDGQTLYYDYSMIQAWFKNQGLEFETISSRQFVENITWGPYTCTESDCTQRVIDNLKTWGFTYFMSEKGKNYAPHYDSIMSPIYTEIGMGMAVDSGNKYYFTIHYDTSIISDPDPICED